MVVNDGIDEVPDMDQDEAAQADIASVSEAIAAVENQPVETPVKQEDEPVETPRDVIPELEDVEDPQEMVDVLLNVGEERSRKNDVKGALAAFNKAIALDPSSDMAWFNRGVLLEAQQDARGARQSFQICLDLNENHAPATANLSILLERIGDLEGAYKMAEKALGFFPAHPALVQLKERCKDSGISVAMEAMQPSLEVTQTVNMETVEEVAEEAGIEDPAILLQEAIHHDHDENAELSVEELKSAAEVVVAQQEIIRETAPEIPDIPEPEPEPTVDLDALVEEATAAIKNGQAKEALALLKPHLKTVGAQHAGAWRIAGGAMARLDLDNHAIAAMTHAQNLDPNHASGWFNLGSVQQRSELVTEALQSYKRAVDTDPTYLKPAEKMAALAMEKGLIETYMEAARVVIGIDSGHPVRQEFIDTLLQMAQGESDVLDQISGLPPTLPAGPEMAKEALSLIADTPSPERARALSLSLQHSDAVLMWKKMIQDDPDEPNHWTGLARSLEQAGDYATAEKCHAKAASMGSSTNPAPETAEPAATPSAAMAAIAAAPPPTTPAPLPTPEEMAGYVSTPPPATPAPLPTPEEMVNPEIPMMPTQESAPVAVQETASAELLLVPVEPQTKAVEPSPLPEVDLAKVALDAAAKTVNPTYQSTSSNAISNQDVAWFNQGVQLIEDKKYREALSCFDRALPAFAGDDAMIIRILNNRGNAFYFLEEYPKCVESYHQAMMIRPTEVRGETLYNMGTAYAEMERYRDAIKCFEQAMPRGLSDEAKRRAKDQIRRCNILQKAMDKKRKKR